jgi:hypothetical protein
VASPSALPLTFSLGKPDAVHRIAVSIVQLQSHLQGLLVHLQGQGSAGVRRTVAVAAEWRGCQPCSRHWLHDEQASRYANMYWPRPRVSLHQDMLTCTGPARVYHCIKIC